MIDRLLLGPMATLLTGFADRVGMARRTSCEARGEGLAATVDRLGLRM